MVARRRDHRPSVVTITCPGSAFVPPVERRRRACHPRNFRWSDDSVTIAEKVLLSAPPIPWNVDPDSHAHILLCNLRQAIHCAQVQAPKVPRQEYISSQAFAFVRAHSHALREYHKASLCIARSSLWATFGFWAGCVWRCRWSPIFGFSSRLFAVRLAFA